MRAENHASLGAQLNRGDNSASLCPVSTRRHLSRLAVAVQIVRCCNGGQFSPSAAFTPSYSCGGPPAARPRCNSRCLSRSSPASLNVGFYSKNGFKFQPLHENNGGGGGDEDVSNNNNDGDEGGSGGDFIQQFKSWLATDEAREDAKIYTTSLTFALLLRFLIIEPRYIPSESMVPTFQIGDQLAVEKITKRVRPQLRNEVVVFTPPQAFSDFLDSSNSRKAKEALIKRIVATEGDEVMVRNGDLYINGKIQNEGFVNEKANYEYGPVVVPSGKLLVLGDNRNHSLDGHYWGFLPRENVIGRAVFIYWPPWRLGNDGMF